MIVISDNNNNNKNYNNNNNNSYNNNINNKNNINNQNNTWRFSHSHQRCTAAKRGKFQLGRPQQSNAEECID